MRSIRLFLFLGLTLLPPVEGFNGGLNTLETLGGKGVDKVHDYAVIPDGYLIVGSTTSFETDKEDVYVIRVNQRGEMIWNKTYCGWESDRGYAVTRTRDNNYVITGASSH